MELPWHSEDDRVPGPRIRTWLPSDQACQPLWSCPTRLSSGGLITDLLHEGCSNVSLHRASILRAPRAPLSRHQSSAHAPSILHSASCTIQHRIGEGP